MTDHVDLRADFSKAVARMESPRLTKLMRIGPRKFMARWLARRRGASKPCPARLFWGGEMKVVIPDAPSEALYTYGLFDPEVTELVLSVVQPGACVIDAGAHFGYVSLLCAHLAGATGRIVSIEPTPSTFAVLAENVGAQPTIMPMQAALGDRLGTTVLHDFGVRYAAWNTLEAGPRLQSVGGALQPSKVTVDVRTIDHLVQSLSLSPNFIKVDTENYEDRVARGMQATLKQFRPAVLLEVGSPQGLEAARFIVGHGYLPHVRRQRHRIEPWLGSLDEANCRFKDLLLMPS
jgi:FkbM family methyltransferase